MLRMRTLLYVPIVYLPISSYGVEPQIEDPFASSLNPVEYSLDSDLNWGLAWSSRSEIHGYYQVDEVRDDGMFDVGVVAFNESYQQFALDSSWQLNTTGQWSSAGRFALIQNQTQTDDGQATRSNDHPLLEGYIEWGSSSGYWRTQVGRVKPQWSNGYNWTPANLLKPSYDQINLDDDDLTQQKGWDMGVLEWRRTNWNTSTYFAHYDDDNSHSNRQYAISVNREGDLDARLVTHHLEGDSTNYAIGFSALLSDDITLRIEGSWQQRRELLLPSDLNYVTDERTGFGRYVLGSQISLKAGWDITFEYLHNQHGYSDEEWQSVKEETAIAKENLQTQLASNAYGFLADSYDQLSLGPLRQHYVYAMIANTRSSHWLHYRQSVQISLDDDSAYHNMEFIQNWNNNITSRFRAQLFTGCESCEYGLLPSEQQIRFSLYYHF